MSLTARWFLAFALAGLAAAARAESPEERTAKHLESIRNQHSLLSAWLQEMPKGGDLHNHLAGAIYAESWVDFAARDGLCVDRTTSMLLAPPCDRACAGYANKPASACAYGDHVLYNQIIDAWSMRNWNSGEESGHDHFFATFDKFQLAGLNSIGDQLAEASARAAADHLQYLELMHTADGMRAAELGAKLGWNDDFSKMRDALLAGGLGNRAIAARLGISEHTVKSHIMSLFTRLGVSTRAGAVAAGVRMGIPML